MSYTFKKRQMEILSQYENQFRSAVEADFCRIQSSTMLKDIDEVYREAIGDKSGLLGGCNRCVLNAMRKIGRMYFNDKEAYAKAEERKNKRNEKNNSTQDE